MMSTTDQLAYSSTISINPYNKTFYRSTASFLQPEKELAYDKTQYVISFLNTKNFITTMIGVSKNIPEEDLPDAIENKIYEELALDLAVEYNIKYIEASHVDESNRFFHVFVVDPLTLEEDFGPATESVKYIDNILPVPLLLKSLYTREIILDNGIHCFIYFQEHDAFLTLYNEQQFIYTKSLKFSIRQMHEQFCELLGEQMSYENFANLIGNEGLSVANNDYQRYLIKLFGETFLHINDVLTYAKRAFSLDKIGTIYIGSQLGTIPGLDEYAQTYLGLLSEPFDFILGYESEEKYVDQIHQLMHLYSQLHELERYECNFSIFHRPPPFLKRSSGQLIVLTAATLVLAFAYPVTFWTLGYAEELRHTLLQDQYLELHNTKITREQTINVKLKEQEKFAQLLKSEKDAFTETKETLIKIHDVKVNYPMKAKLLSQLTEDLNRYEVQVTKIGYNEINGSKRTFSLTLSAPSDKHITSMLEDLTLKKGDGFNFALEDIAYEANTTHYISQLKAEIQ